MSIDPVTRVPLLDLQAQYEPYKAEVMAAISRVFDSKQFIMGPEIKKLEEKIADYCEVSDAVGVSSGTDALVISLMALGVGAGDEVITTPFTFFATAGSIARVGAVPVFVDIEPDTYNIDPQLIEAAITKKTKAIIPVHLFGQMSEMDAIMDIADRHGLYVIEDAAQAIGSEYRSRSGETKRAGSVGHVGCFSFFPSKNLGCCGDGGIVTTKDPKLAEKLRVLRVHGSKPKYYHHIVGGNFRLDPMQAAVLSVKLPFLDDQHKGRQKNAEYYDSHLKTVKRPFVREGYRMIYNQYTISTPQRDMLQKTLSENGIGCMIYYPVPLHVQTCFESLGYKEGDFPVSEKAAKEVLSIPIFPELTQTQLEAVSTVINQAVK